MQQRGVKRAGGEGEEGEDAKHPDQDALGLAHGDGSAGEGTGRMEGCG